ncbi:MULTISPECIES: ACP S-malonyltransferase [Syntrophotalea]|jgi:[acyl-carrier-protein] S-malonyltransferase|uniref:Malonyl CoA-acyl carrier protein transacylase n=1 Tax=Syntrophotalea acetylenica TaxID=29542 RepID=A0A1L3GID2_SYNAC|nr:ACP S-malonyltransferase [Syntrophotalea acetylenica]APG25635.1 malonyl CoA-acyl carrier protein transacylase [Syntrophotalea acetylenica]APG43708.1 malonyl CoA-acyl carrier protein transacylase [Syntrophotalea acetylenica]MDY0262509.1 ACP S-malonyltransferase [Syntrophotalea acetylenica]
MKAFVFPGQGSQFAGMGKDLAETFSQARLTFEEANEALGMNLAKLCFEGPEADLKLTANTQPAIVTTSIAALRVLREETGLSPDYVAGHSLGEYAALVCAGALSFADAVRTVRLRGAFMQDAVPVGVGAMAAIIGLDAADVDGICREVAGQEVVAPANYNSPGQIVIAGHVAAVERAMAHAKERGAKRALPLPVSAPFHCMLMEPASRKLAEVLADVPVSSLCCPLVSNVEAVPSTDAGAVRDLLVRQVYSPVRWEESVLNLVASGVEQFVEIGPGKVLAGLIKRIAKGADIQNLGSVDDLKTF